MAGYRLLFINIYAPNTDDPDFFYTLRVLIDRTATDHILLGGDLNLLLNPALDSTAANLVVKPRLLHIFHDMQYQLAP